ncbi:hypothetical protein ZWY2020_048277 [Hordeum vulgare]|nr:hypothetical protein ZWY2020_048277 [Hordeum vulgare]
MDLEDPVVLDAPSSRGRTAAVPAPVVVATHRRSTSGTGTHAVPVEIVAPAPPAPSFVAPPMPSFVAPPMGWLLAGSSAPFLGEEDAGLAPPPTPPYYPGLRETAPPLHPQLPTPTPSDEDPIHFFPPGYGPVPSGDWEVMPTEEEQQWLTTAVKKEPSAPSTADGTSAPILDINADAGVQIEEAASSSTPPSATRAATPPPPPSTPPPEARRILRRFAAALERTRPGLSTGSWAPAGLNLPGYPAGGSPFL